MMGPIDSFTTCLSKSFTWSGRASRSEFWWFKGATYLLIGGAMAFDYAMFPQAQWSASCIAAFVLTYPASVASSVRRMHDLNLSGWRLLLAAWPVGALAVFLFLVKRGTSEGNRFDAELRGPEARQPEVQAQLANA